MPEICFGNNELRLHHGPSNFTYIFNAFDALQLVNADGTGEGTGMIKVAYAAEWQRSRTANLNIVDVVRNNDWTYTTVHPGRLEDGPVSVLDFFEFNYNFWESS